MNGSDAVIAVRDMVKTYVVGEVEVRALRGVSLEVKRGEFVCVTGPSGSGKSTLMHIIGCLDRPTSGQYILDGKDVSRMSKDQLAEVRNAKIGFVFQGFNLLSRTSAIDNVELPLLYNASVSSKQRHERAVKALQAVKLGDRLDHLPNQLSGGQQQRVAIARALVNEPVMILADEATGNLDTRTSYEIMALLQELNQQQGKTIVFVTHEPDIAAFSNRTITLKDGKVVKDSQNQQVRSAREMLATLPVAADY